MEGLITKIIDGFNPVQSPEYPLSFITSFRVPISPFLFSIEQVCCLVIATDIGKIIALPTLYV